MGWNSSRRSFRALPWLAAACCVLAGCAAPRTVITSRGDAGSARTSQRLLVVSQLARADKDWADPFETALLAELRRYRLTARVQTRDPVAVQSDKVRYAAELAAYKPDTVLVVEPGEGTADAYGRQIQHRFELGMFKNYTDRTQRELTWRASVILQPAGYYIGADDMPALARDIVSRLAIDGILMKPSPHTAPPRRMDPW